MFCFIWLFLFVSLFSFLFSCCNALLVVFMASVPLTHVRLLLSLSVSVNLSLGPFASHLSSLTRHTRGSGLQANHSSERVSWRSTGGGKKPPLSVIPTIHFYSVAGLRGCIISGFKVSTFILYNSTEIQSNTSSSTEADLRWVCAPVGVQCFTDVASVCFRSFLSFTGFSLKNPNCTGTL